MAAVIESWFRQDLQKPVQVHYLDGSLFSNNGNGNRIGVELTNNGEDYTVTGTVSGYAVLADGSTVPCTGSKSGNKASIIVPPAAYLPGNIFITIFLTDGTTVTTLAAVSSNVIQARTDNQVSPGSVVTDWTNTINAAMQSVETAAANLGQVVATPYAQLTFPVPLGKYTYYNNNMYRCTTPIPSSEDFTAAHWSSALNLGDEVSALKSALSNEESRTNKILLDEKVDIIDGIEWEIGFINSSGDNVSSTTYIRTKDYIDIRAYTKIQTKINTGYVYSFHFYTTKANTGHSRITGSSDDYDYLAVPNNAKYMRIVVSDSNAGTASLSYANQITVSGESNLYNKLNTLSGLKCLYVGQVNQNNGFIGSTGSITWNTADTYKHIAVPVNGGESVTIEAGVNGSMVAFLANYVKNSSITYATGYSNRIVISAGNTEEYTLPSDCKYLYVQTLSDSTNKVPTVLKLNSYDITKRITDSIVDIDIREKEDVQSIQENINDIKDFVYSNIALDGATYELGSISTTTGEDISADTRIRNGYVYIENAKKIAITITEGYKYRIYFFTSNASSGLIKPVANFVTEDTIIDVPTNALYFRIVLGDTNDSTSITISDFNKITLGSITELEKKINGLREDVDLLLADGLPTYWVDYFITKQSRLDTYDVELGRNGVSFAFVTDVHVSANNGNSPKVLEYIVKNTNIRNVICGGDIINLFNTKANAINELALWARKTSGLKIVNLHGNHDNNSNSQTDSTQILTDADFYALECRQSESFVTFVPGKLYGYSDNADQKVRFIYLDTGAPDSAVIDDDQVNWMKARIQELESGWTVLLFAHQFFTGANATEPTISFDQNGTKIMNALDSIYDSVNAVIACVIVGHCHRNWDYTSSKGYKIIATTCDAGSFNSSQYDPDTPNRTAGTTTEQCIDLYYINTTQNVRSIKILRIGAGDTAQDRNFTY